MYPALPSVPTTTTTTTTSCRSCRPGRHETCRLVPFSGMIFLLFMITLIASLMGAPMPLFRFLYRDPLAIIFYTRCEDDCMFGFHTQFTLGLIMSCMTTICLTTAVAFHPDIPPRGENVFTSLKKFLWPIVYPESMLVNAFRQVLAARTVAQLYNEERREELGESCLIWKDLWDERVLNGRDCFW